MTTDRTEATSPGPSSERLGALADIEQRLLWLSTRIIDAANHDRPSDDGIKVGGHQASSASMVSIMTALWFHHLGAGDRVSVKPHASPVLHAINYLLGTLDRSMLTRLRSYGGLQAYPSRTKDPDPVDFSTGSVGLGATAPLFAAATRRYVDEHFGPHPPTRFVALMGDAELDEGNIWEALLDPALSGLGNVLWIVDLNRQSLDRVVPGIKARSLSRAFSDVGWQVLEAKYGRELEAAFLEPGGDSLRRRIDEMPNDEYQSLYGLDAQALRNVLCDGHDDLRTFLERYADDQLAALVRDLGGHDLATLLDCFERADDDPRPTVVLAYTIKGYGLPFAGDAHNHSALLTTPQIDALRAEHGLDPEHEWDPFDPISAPGMLVSEAIARLKRPSRRALTHVQPPRSALGAVSTSRPISTQEAFGRILSSLHREEVGSRIVTIAPDVSVSTNLGGWINKVGVFAPELLPDRARGSGPLRWDQSPAGQHIELGISEMNLFSMLAQLGLAWDLSDEPLLPIGTVYDPFVCRGLDALIYAVYNGARFVIAGTPSGVTLAPEGGAHQSAITASIGLELPGLTFAEPAFATALDWLLCDGLQRVGDLTQPPESMYLRLTTRPIEQGPFAAAMDRIGEERLHEQVLLGGYRLVDPEPDSRPRVAIATSGALVPEALRAAADLKTEGMAALVIDITSLDRLYTGWVESRRAAIRSTAADRAVSQVARLLEPGLPIVTVHDAASHAMSWLGSVHGSRVVPLGVDDFGQSGGIADLHRSFNLDSGSIVNGALLAAGY